QVPGRGFIDMYPLEAESFIKQVIAMDWDRLIPGHPGVNGRLGTKQDARDQLRLLEEASAEMKPLGISGKCWGAEKDLKLSNFKDWPGYQTGLEFIGRRDCGVGGRGTEETIDNSEWIVFSPSLRSRGEGVVIVPTVL